MWCFSDPSDPSDPGPDPGTPLPPSASGGSPLGGVPPANMPGGPPGPGPGPAPGSTPVVPPPLCGPGAVAPCPCATATVTSEMVMTEPPDRARIRMGVGERVRTTYSLGSAAWTVAGGGTLSATSGATVTYTAPNTAGSVTLTATGGGCSASITFTIVAPKSVRMVKKFTSAARVEHTQSFPDVGMFTNIFLAPDDVNFHRVEFLELEIGCTAVGVYACQNGKGHGPNPNGLGATTHVQAGVGTFMNASDHVYSGHCGLAYVAPGTGSEHFAIPWRWRVGHSGAFNTLSTVDQRVSCDAAGLCTATKAGARVSVQAAAATSAP